MYRRTKNTNRVPDDRDLRFVLGALPKRRHDTGDFYWTPLVSLYELLDQSIRHVEEAYADQHHRPGVTDDLARMRAVEARLETHLGELVVQGFVEYKAAD